MSNQSNKVFQIHDRQEENGRDEADYLSFKPGQRLKKARELRGMAVEQVAQELNLTPRYVQAMEADSYAELPEPAFVRGYMRRYAQLVKLSPDDIAAKFDQCYAEDKATPAPDTRPHNPIQVLGVIARRQPVKGRRLLGWAAILLAAALVIGFLWTGVENFGAFPSLDTAPAEQPVVVPGVPAPAPETTTPATPAPAGDAPALPGGSVLPAPAGPAVLPAPSAAAPATSGPAAAADSLTITLTQESWVSVTDARQQQLVNALTAPQTLNLRGEAPFSVNIGNAPAASVAINGRSVDLRPYTRGAVATLTIPR